MHLYRLAVGSKEQACVLAISELQFSKTYVKLHTFLWYNPNLLGE